MQGPYPQLSASGMMGTKSVGLQLNASVAPQRNVAAAKFVAATRACMTRLAYIPVRSLPPAKQHAGQSCG